ncbi:hypothetical protein 162322512 [Organic Lake phycodnavirus 1]|nr:hypothetical protein 162322512 [Organic Lake phycodnavirus 1]
MIMMKLLILLILLYLYFMFSRQEGFTVLEESSLIKIDHDILDRFYAKIYDDLYDTLPIHTKECEQIVPYLRKSSNVLCLDCRTGHMVQLLSNYANITGLETSSYMINYAKQLYPELKFQYGKYNPYITKLNTHIICPLFSIHTKYELGNFLSVCYGWLIHKGFLFITYLPNIDHIKDIIQHNPREKFLYHYNFSLNVEKNAGYSIVTENIYNKHTLKRKNIWNYQQIKLDNLIYEASLKGLKFMKDVDLGTFRMAIFTKST